ncbi:hypothetical protein BDN70DRAFT_346031 [Pholiota conissans]|uniref:Uncharacterized protein n=1 Tax=Pholiota conissans TaxID=109636 RepID=A0A9P6CVY4_9AGAR|nr:hypothetical protein BDN70DRAFT_346031 [Pholiota conissans]
MESYRMSRHGGPTFKDGCATCSCHSTTRKRDVYLLMFSMWFSPGVLTFFDFVVRRDLSQLIIFSLGRPSL